MMDMFPINGNSFANPLNVLIKPNKKRINTASPTNDESRPPIKGNMFSMPPITDKINSINP